MVQHQNPQARLPAPCRSRQAARGNSPTVSRWSRGDTRRRYGWKAVAIKGNERHGGSVQLLCHNFDPRPSHFHCVPMLCLPVCFDPSSVTLGSEVMPVRSRAASHSPHDLGDSTPVWRPLVPWPYLWPVNLADRTPDPTRLVHFYRPRRDCRLTIECALWSLRLHRAR